MNFEFGNIETISYLIESWNTPREIYKGEDIYLNLPPPVLDKIMKYHRIANTALEPKRTVLWSGKGYV